MTYDEVKTAWDVQVDEHNQWDSLNEDEKIEWAFNDTQQKGSGMSMTKSQKSFLKVYNGYIIEDIKRK